jgi:hypothetical protein
MRERCLQEACPAYPYYGGAGVSIDPSWLIFENFLADMGERPKGTTLSRFADSGNYEPGNCACHTWKEQRAEARKKKAMMTVNSGNSLPTLTESGVYAGQ